MHAMLSVVVDLAKKKPVKRARYRDNSESDPLTYGYKSMKSVERGRPTYLYLKKTTKRMINDDEKKTVYSAPRPVM